MILEFKKSEFSCGVNLPIFEKELGEASLTGMITSVDNGVTHLTINGDDKLNNTKDISAIKTVVKDHSGSDLADKGYGESDGESQTTSDNYQETLKLTISNLEAGDYLISGSTEGKTSSDGTAIEMQVQVDDATIIGEPENSVDVYVPLSGFKKLNLSEGAHNFDIDFRTNQVGTNVKLRNARIRVRKF